ncbi:MAG: oxygenase MpaB family protein [Burkholderiaceae bacterium]|nr:oxygenase MpaB family protein [Burkholderiaceae bacterium]
MPLMCMEPYLMLAAGASEDFLQPRLRQMLAQQIRGMAGSSSGPPVAFLEPAGDPGWFGPDSVTWQVHAHLVSMLVGGLSSLLIQAMHPGALAGVWDHSSFRTDLKARLGRTAYFIAATTYGGHAMAQKAIDHVNHIHQRVTGLRPDGQPYDARDPYLLRWVHLGETLSFLKAYCTHADTSMPVFMQNQYIFEMQRIGLALGATDLPQTLASAEQMLLSYRTELVIDDRVREVTNLIQNFPARRRDRLFVKLITAAAFDLLPGWVLSDLGIARAPAWQRKFTQQALALASVPLDWALATEGVSAHARRRLAANQA